MSLRLAMGRNCTKRVWPCRTPYSRPSVSGFEKGAISFIQFKGFFFSKITSILLDLLARRQDSSRWIHRPNSKKVEGTALEWNQALRIWILVSVPHPFRFALDFPYLNGQTPAINAGLPFQ